jgi:hypothetical protein
MTKLLRRKWTAEDDAQLRSLLETRASLGLVTAKLRRTLKAVRTRSSKLRISCSSRDARAVKNH